MKINFDIGTHYHSFKYFKKHLLRYEYQTGYKFNQGSSTTIKNCHIKKLEGDRKLQKKFEYYFCPFKCEYSTKKLQCQTK